MVQLDAMRSFVEVAALGSFTQAADQLNIPRMRMTRHIQELEDWLQVRLLHRTTRRVSLTTAGEEALRICERILNDAAALENSAQQYTQGLVGDIRIAAPIGVGQGKLLQLIEGFCQQHKNVSFQFLLSDKNAQLVDERVDIALRYTHQPDDNLIARQLFESGPVLCAAPAYLAEQGTPTTVAELSQHRCLVHLNQSQWHFPSGEEVKVRGPLRANDAVTLVDAARAGMGIARLPSDLVDGFLENGELVALPDIFALSTQAVWAVYLSRSYQQPVVRTFIDYAVEQWR
nr:LysR family transcriptional regulator [uncultured Amphritea sp.]